MTYTFDDNIISDLHKDARGYRPSVAWMHAWQTSTKEEKQGIWDMLIEELNDAMEMQRLEDERSISNFKALVQKTIELGAGDEETALRWLVQDETFYSLQDVEHWVWDKGILFSDYGRELVKRLNSIVDYKEWEVA